MKQESSQIRLFVPELPDTTDAMVSGGVYAMVADTPPARFPLLAATLEGNRLQRRPVTLLVATDPKTFLDRLSSVGFGGGSAALETGQLGVFQFQEDLNKNLFRFGMDAFTKELDFFGLPKNSLLVIDQADDLFSLHDLPQALNQADGLSQWARQSNTSVLLVFTRAAVVPSALAVLNGLMDYLSGIVRLGGHQAGLELTFEYWQSPEGTVAARVYHLNMLENGQYQIRQPDVIAGLALDGPDRVTEPASPADQNYLYLDPAVGQIGKQMSGRWQQCESVMGILRQAHGLGDISVLLTFERQTTLRELAESVHSLRLTLGKTAQIVVFERDASLRYQNEILLLRLGANLIVHRDVPSIRIPLMLESLAGQMFTREIEMQFDEALASVSASSQKGYLPKQLFISECNAIVERAELLNLPCTLVRAKAVGGKTPEEVLSNLRINRPGDITTHDGENCYLFFSGCPQASLEQAMLAVTNGNVMSLFTHVQYWVSREELRNALRNFGPVEHLAATLSAPKQAANGASLSVENPFAVEHVDAAPVVLRVVSPASKQNALLSASSVVSEPAVEQNRSALSFRPTASSTVSPLRRMVARRVTETQANSVE
jgi:cellulose biosynthesis protein BcsE